MSNYITVVESVFAQRAYNYWTPYGKPVKEEVIFRTPEASKTRLYFAEGSLFVYDMWESNKYGSTAWRVIIARALGVGESGFIVPNITPAVNVLFDVTGKERSQLALAWLKKIAQNVNVLSLKNSFLEIENMRFTTLSIPELKAYVTKL